MPAAGATVGGDEVHSLTMPLASSSRTGEAHGGIARARQSVASLMCPMTLPTWWPHRPARRVLYAPGWHFGFNLPAFLIVMLLTVVLVRGIRESAETNNVMVILKIAAILAFVFVGMRFIHPAVITRSRRRAGPAC